MKIIMKIAATTIVLTFMIFADISILSLQFVPEAQAIFGVRRRTAVVAYSAGAHTASASAASSSAAASQQQAATTEQQATPHAASTVPVGTVVQDLPTKCTAVTVANNQYQDCEGSFYRAAFQGDKLVYVVVDSPI